MSIEIVFRVIESSSLNGFVFPCSYVMKAISAKKLQRKNDHRGRKWINGKFNLKPTNQFEPFPSDQNQRNSKEASTNW